VIARTPAAIAGLETVSFVLDTFPERWTKNVTFRDRDETPIKTPDDACFACVLGLVRIAIPDTATRMIARHALERETGGIVPEYNDAHRRTVAEMRLLVEHTIARLRAGK
jgi:hypothetical protein